MPRVGSDPNSIVRQHFPNHTLSTFIDGNSRWWQMYQKVTKGGASTSASSSPPAASSSSSALAPTSSRPSSAFLSAETRDAVVEHASSTSAPRSASSPLRSSPSSSFPDSTLDVSSDTVHGVRTSRTRWNARLALSPYGQRPLSRWIPSEEKRMEDMFALSEIFPYITEGEELEEEMDLHELIAANLHETNNEEKDTNGHAEKLDRDNPAVDDEVNEEIAYDLQQEPGSQGMSAEEEEDGDESQDEFGSAHSVAPGKKEKNKKKKAKARAKAKEKRQKGHTGDAGESSRSPTVLHPGPLSGGPASSTLPDCISPLVSGWVLTMAKLGQLVEALGFDPQKKRDNAELIERVRAALLQAVPERQDAQWQQSVLDELKRMEELTDQMEKWHKQLASGNVENFMAESEKWERELKAQQAKWERQSAEALRLQREEVERQARRRASGEEEQLHEQEEDEESVADSMQGSYSSASESGTGATDPEVEESESDSDNEEGSVEEIRSATPGASSSSDREAFLAATPKPPATPFTPSSPGYSLSDPGAKVRSSDPSDTPGFDSIPVNVPQQTSPPLTIPSSIPTDTSATQTSGPINELIITKVPAAVGPSTTSAGSNTPSASTSTPTITRIPVPRLQNVNDPPPPITPRQPINWNIAPPAPANPIEYLTNHPWTMIEVLLLLEVVAHFPPTEHGMGIHRGRVQQRPHHETPAGVVREAGPDGA
ncbi:hypothetical protein A0H81_07018 [Grifola frondosa]|uniref:Uncharacterized protein n=1 Tax=Grifola frondosa TaxID=5627 RepID=A0A1C7M929_GRIFR|nr:hypothetical protein A0H81_07018 [Grifola frondosa]